LENTNKVRILSYTTNIRKHTVSPLTLYTSCRNNCYDNFKLTKCKILDEKYEGEIAIVKFIATMIQVDLKEKTSFMETSTFEKLTQGKMMGAWLYKSGIVESVPSEI